VLLQRLLSVLITHHPPCNKWQRSAILRFTCTLCCASCSAAALFTSAPAALQGDEAPETLDALGRLSLAKRGFQIVRVPMPPDLEAGSGLPDDAVPVSIPQANGDTLIDAIEFYGDINQNSVAEAQVSCIL
jgi:hypothetical protein